MAHFKKEVEVYLKGSDGQADHDYKYKIRSCGKKQATLDRIWQEDRPLYCSSKGRNFYITPPEDARSTYGSNIPHYVKTNWSQYFVLAGIDGWDPSEN